MEVVVAERVDEAVDGRLGTGEASSRAELGGFSVDWDTKRDQWTDQIEALSRMMVETPFAGWDGKWLQMPPRNVVPKPLQQICESLELMGAEVIGEFAERHRGQWERKCERLAPAIDAALARKAPPRTSDEGYSFEAAARA